MGISQIKKIIGKGIGSQIGISWNKIVPLIMKPKFDNLGQLSISVPSLNKLIIKEKIELMTKKENETLIDGKTLHENLQQLFLDQISINSLTLIGPFLNFQLNKPLLSKDVLNRVFIEKNLYGQPNEIESFHLNLNNFKEDKVLIEFSSPNIAKPFHVGHLRSTILGNFIKNLILKINPKQNVLAMNYLGDWGKQYGLLAVGFERYGNETKLKEDAINHLYEVYVKTSKQVEDGDMGLDDEAKDWFKKMESGDELALKRWYQFKELSIDHFQKLYNRMNINFDIYSSESKTESYIQPIFDMLIKNNLILNKDNAKFIDLSKYQLGKPIIQKEDGTTLYLTRDLAAVLQRLMEVGFDRMIYVVGNEQELHMNQLFQIIKLIENDINLYIKRYKGIQLNQGWSEKLQHIGFGKINNMSTRKGTAIFLNDILNQAQIKMLNVAFPLNYDNITLNDKQVANQLGISAVVTQDFMAKRVKNYEFSWNRMIDSKGDSGVYLQYCYARLCGIERNSNVPFSPDADLTLLTEPICHQLTQLISEYPDILSTTRMTLEPSTLVTYLFNLCHATSKATELLRVKDLNNLELSKARWALFYATRQVLKDGLNVLGLKVVEKM